MFVHSDYRTHDLENTPYWKWKSLTGINKENFCFLLSVLIRHLYCCMFLLFSSPCQRKCELLPSLGVHGPSYVVCRPLTFHTWIFSSETPQPNEVKLGRKHLWKVLSKECSWTINKHGHHRQFFFLIGRFF